MSHSKGNWKVGRPGTVVTDNSDGFPANNIDGRSEIAYYGGYLIAESILKSDDAKLLAESKNMFELLSKIVEWELDEGEIIEGSTTFKMKEIIERITGK